jgi:hypothetical protein
VHKLAETERRIAALQTLRVELDAQLARLGAAPTCRRVGGCGCWLPTREEVRDMVTEVADDSGCSCCGCPDPTC